MMNLRKKMTILVKKADKQVKYFNYLSKYHNKMSFSRYLYYMLSFLYIMFNNEIPDDFSLMPRNPESGSDRATRIRDMFSGRNYNNEFSPLTIFRVYF